MFNSTNNNCIVSQWQEIDVDDVKSEVENCSDHELPVSSIITITDNIINTKRQKIDSNDMSDLESYSDNELPISSISNELLLINSNIIKSDVQKSETINYQLKPNSIYDTKLNINAMSYNEQNLKNNLMNKYECDICGKVFLQRILIIEHFRTSLCFPESPLYFENSSYICDLYNNFENSILYINGLNNLVTNSIKDECKCRICQILIQNNNYIKTSQILHIKESNLGNTSCDYDEYNKSCMKSNGLKNQKMMKLYNCQLCNKQFTDLSLLMEHNIIHNLKSVNQCNICLKFVNNSKSNKSKHSNRKQNFSKSYECSKCSNIFFKRSEIVTHIFKNHQENYSKYSCDSCSKLYKSSRELVLHLKKNVFKCDVCPQSFTTSYRLHQHYKWHIGINSFECQYCPQIFSEYSIYLYHERTHTGENPFRCNFCGKWFPVSSNINIHLKFQNPFICNICQKKNSQKSSLLSHKSNHSNTNTLKRNSYKKYNSQSLTLNEHSRCETDEKLYTCNKCNKSFIYLSTLILHLKSHDLPKNDMNYKYFSTLYAMNNQRNHLPNIYVKCNFCKKIFYDQNNLISHKCLYKCELCEEIFFSIHLLKKHKNIHKKNKPFKSDSCETSFVCSTNLNRCAKEHNQFKKNVSLNGINKINNEENNYIKKEYKCDLCFKIFCSQYQISTHILEIHY